MLQTVSTTVLLIKSVLLTTCLASLLECMEFFLSGTGSWMRLIIRWREPCLCLLGEPVCLLGQPCCLQLQQPARWDLISWGDGGWGDGWLCGFTLGGGLARDSLSNGMCHKQSTHLSGRRHHCYHIGLDLRVICVAVHVIGGVCDGYGSWHNVEHGKRSRACCVEDTLQAQKG